ncbi:MAG: DUF2889 domain-containing protein [Desulfatiglans sp.]|jgi:hypothetical protein|nr:DUF2889 domain-containing protein [Desulfatiglans sp.]
MITLSRTQIVGAELIDSDTIRINGIQEDHIYGMEIHLDVNVPKGEIVSIEGWMKRYTNPVCTEAVDVLQNAVGINLREEKWEYRLMKNIGRKGCEHFAEILIECGRSFDQARMAKDLEEALKADPALDQQQFCSQWVKDHPEIEAGCLARSR